MTKSIDEWAAEQCGVDWIANRYGWFLYPVNHAITEDVHAVKWTIKDPRCREIVREHFQLMTATNNSSWSCYQNRHYPKTLKWGVTIAEAEIACITEIYEAEK